MLKTNRFFIIAPILTLLVSFFLFNPFSAFAATSVSGAISQNTTWTQAQGPYVVNSTVSVDTGVTLTIEPGVVVKFASNLAQLYINGSLTVNGTAANKVYFTSYEDDTVGGDTNGNGPATSPLAKDWIDMQFNAGSTGTIANAVVRYGGFHGCNNFGCFGSQSGLFNNGGTVTISDSQFSYNNIFGILHRSGSISVTSSEMDHEVYGFSLGLGATVAIVNSSFHDNSLGVTTSNTGSLTLTHNTFADNASGAASINGLVNFTHSGNTASGTGRKAFVISGDIASDRQWNNELPYIITSGLTINAGKTLTIDPGVIIKYDNFTSSFVVNGTLNVNGTKEAPVFLTSIYDDAAGGDTNGDGNASAPVHGDWMHIRFNVGSTGNLTHAIIMYGGGFAASYAGIYNKGGNVNISHSEIAYNGNFTNFIGVRQDSGNLTVSDSSIHDHGYGASNYSLGNPIQAINNWWGDATGPYHPLLNPQGRGNRVSDNVNFIPWSTYDPTKQPAPRDPVIIIPGILGSAEKNGVWVIDPIFHTYDDLIATLEANGYVDGKDLFTMPYDWHRSNVLTALQLRDKINEVQQICQCAKVDLVAHSMGGLVARQYIQSSNYENDVDQLIFLGTPHLGSPKSYLMWEGGETDLTREDRAMKFFLSREGQKAGFASLFDYVRNRPIPTVKELLPVYDYLRDKSSGNLRTYPINYPQNTFLENLKNSMVMLFTSGVRITNIIGKLGDVSTIGIIRATTSLNSSLWEHGYPDGFYEKVGDGGLERKAGDGTVPLESGGFIAIDLNELNSEHSQLPTRAEGLVFKKLTGKDATTLITSNTDSIFDTNFRLLIIKLLSPVDVVVTAPDGKRIGKDFQTNTEMNEIDRAFYSGFSTDNEYITIPNPLDGEYKVELQGTGTGEYTVASAYISDSASAEKDFTAQTRPGLVSELNLSVDSADPQGLDVKPADMTPPEITISSPQSRDYLRSETLPVNVAIHDVESDIASSGIKFDDRIVHAGDSIDLFFEKLGGHAVSVSASDMIGNATSSVVNFRIIATIESTISDIERAYSLGWISRKTVKDNLLKKLQAAIKLERRIEILEENLPGKLSVTKRIEKIEKRIDKILAKELIKELERENPKNINDIGLNLLKEDINWLLNN